MKNLKKHLSVANVLAWLALFVALGGGAYAATAMLPNKSVKTKHLAKGVVTTQKLRNGAVTAAKIRNGAVTGAKIGAGAVGSTQLLDGGVRAADLGGGVVTTGKLKDGAVTAGKLADGAVTAAKLAPSFSAQLVKNVSYVTATSATDSEQVKTVKAECPAGKQVTGGGAKAIGAESVAVTESAPVVDGSGKRVAWSATAREIVADAANWSVEAYAICAEF